MALYFNKNRIEYFLELQRSVNGKTQDLDEEEDEKKQKEENEEDDEHSTSDYEEEPDYELGDEDGGGEPSEDDETSNSEENSEDQEEEDDEHSTSDYEDEPDYELGGEDDESGDEGGGEGDSEDLSDDSDYQDSSTDMSEDEIKQMEAELYKSIPEDQMKLKNIELKKLYLDIYNTIDSIITRTNKLNKNASNANSIDFVLKKLFELKDLVKFYSTNTFDTKSYIENQINYQHYLATLNIINKIFDEIKNKNNDK